MAILRSKKNTVDRPCKIFKRSSRLIIAVSGERRPFKPSELFYISSGQNSTMPRTLLEFNGFQRKTTYSKKYGTRLKGWFKKPLGSKLYLRLSEVGLYHPEMCRFSNIKSMIISYKIGTGFWKTEDAIPFIKYIHNCVEFKLDYSSEIKDIKSALNIENTLHELTLEEALNILYE